MITFEPNITKINSINNSLFVTVAEMGIWLNLSPSAISSQTALLEELIKTATEVIENYTWLTLRLTEYEANYDLNYRWFNSLISCQAKLLLDRSPILTLSDIIKIEYLDNNNTYTEFDRGALTTEGLYENVTERKEMRNWASIYFIELITFQKRLNAYSIKVTFTAGYDTTETQEHLKIPAALKTAIKKIVAYNYRNRGDCDEKGCNIDGYPVPCSVIGMLDSYSIARTVLS